MSDVAEKTTPTWGYSKGGDQIFDLKQGESLPKGSYPSPAMVPGSKAEAAYREDAEREGAEVPWDTEKKNGKAKKADDTTAKE